MFFVQNWGGLRGLWPATLYITLAGALSLRAAPIDNWQERGPLPGNPSFTDIVYGNGLFVAVGSGTIATSRDGKTWSLQSTDAHLRAVAYGNGVFVAVTVGGGIWQGGIYRAFVSRDGTTWSETTLERPLTDAQAPLWSFNLSDVGFGADQFIVVGTYVTYDRTPEGGHSPQSHNYLGSSLDGTNWAHISSAGSEAVTHSGGVFVISGSDRILFSRTRGTSWETAVWHPWASFPNLVFGGDKFVAAGRIYHAASNDVSLLYTSTNGSQWTSYPTTNRLGAMAFGEGIFASAEGTNIFVSRDGIVWERKHVRPSGYLSSIAYGGGTFVAVGWQGAIVQSDPVAAPAGQSNFVVLKSFGTGAGEGHPFGGLLLASDGMLYGTTSGLATPLEHPGTIFRLTTNGSSYGVLHIFDGTDGIFPNGDLIEGSDGKLYGTTRLTAFSLNKDGSGFEVLHRFTGTNGDGGQARAGLIEAADGLLYGTTYSGGESNCGTIFTIRKAGTGYRVLHSFSATTGDGKFPIAKLLQASDGSLYGTTLDGGLGLGTIFKLATSGSNYAIVHNFGGLTGWAPSTALIEGRDGALYGTTDYTHRPQCPDCVSGYDGLIFRINKDGSGYFTLKRDSFLGGALIVRAGLLEATDRFLYGAAPSAIYRLESHGTGFRIIHQSDGNTGGYFSTLLEGRDGALYGTTWSGGDSGGGTVFRFTPPRELLFSREGTGRVHLSIRAFSGQRVAIQASTDLLGWSNLVSQGAVQGAVIVLDDEAPQLPHRFYRAVTQP